MTRLICALCLASVAVQPGLCLPWLESQGTGQISFIMHDMKHLQHKNEPLQGLRGFQPDPTQTRHGERGGSVVEPRTKKREVGGFETYLRLVVSFSKTLYSAKVLVIPRKRWLRPDMTEKLLTGTLHKQTNQAVWLHKMAKALKFRIKEEEGWYYLCTVEPAESATCIRAPPA